MNVRRLIITADDFGMSLEVNEAVEEAHRRGILTSASLVVTGEAAEDAIARAKRMPSLGVGLHLALVSAPSALGSAQIPDLLDEGWRWLGNRPGLIGTRIALSRRVLSQAEAETRAQLDLFRKTGLALDHVDGHWHFHQHPSVVDILAEHARAFNIRAVRVPYEPALPSWRAAARQDLPRRALSAAAHLPLAMPMKRVLRRAGIVFNDWFFGMNDGGAMSRDRLLGFLANLPPGVTEIGTHPARRAWTGPHAPPRSWRVEDEMSALLDKDVIAACRGPAQQLVRFIDLVHVGAT